MVLGGKSPLLQRSAADLGRFSLGLKTASFSQCRCLTVASRSQHSSISIRRWDLDYVTRPDVNEWRLLSDAPAGSEDRLAALAELPSGTLVLWDRMDRLTAGLEDGGEKAERAFFAIVERIEQHLAMVFHRRMERSDDAPPVRLHMGAPGASIAIRPWDPFLRHHQATQPTPEETIHHPTGSVQVQCFVLPHKDRLDPKAFEAAGGRNGWTAQQGFYVYRNDRLLVAGGWLGLGSPRQWTREEQFKLARISIRFPNSADQDWDIDVKKSVARPPRWLQHRLESLAEITREQARRVFVHRGAYGRREAQPDLQQVWIAKQLAAGSAYAINRDHPLVTSLLAGENRRLTDQVLRLVEESVPIQRIWLDSAEKGDFGSEPFSSVNATEPDSELAEMAGAMFVYLTQQLRFTPEIARQRMLASEPFNRHPDIVNAICSSSESNP
jgi:hypothetical protein